MATASKRWAAVYTRVSTSSQTDRSQEHQLRQYVKSTGLGPVRWYRDTATGANLDRPAFERMTADIAKGRIGTVVLWRLDRLSRSMRDGIVTLAEWCERGIRVVSITQNLDFNGTVGKLIAAVLLGVAEMERAAINERIKAGLAAARAKGVRLGRPKGRLTDPAKRRLDPAEARRMVADGEKVRAVAARFRVTKAAVYRVLRQEANA